MYLPAAHRYAQFLTAACLVLFVACGGGGSTPPPVVPPAGLTYGTNPAVYTKGTAISANAPLSTGGPVASYSVAPALPAGLLLNTSSGVLSGTPSALAPVASYTVTASNASGSTQATLSLTVNDVAPAFSYGLSSAAFGVGLVITPLSPTSSGGAIVSWSVTPGLPSGLTLDPATGVISGTPTVGIAGVTYTIMATNSGGTLGQDLTLTVFSGAPGITSYQATPARTTYGGSVALDWTLAGGASGTQSLFLNGTPVAGLLSGSASVIPARRATYTLAATNLLGTTTQSLTVPSKGLDLVAGNLGGAGTQDGPVASARFYSPNAAAVDAAGTIYIADNQNHTIRKILGGVVSTLAGVPGQAGAADGPGATARFQNPSGVAVDGNGNVYVADMLNHTIRLITPAGVVSTFAGLAGTPGSADGTGATARFNWPYRLALDGSGSLLVAEVMNKTIRRVTPAGVVTTFVGTAGVTGSADGTGASAQFNRPAGLALDAGGNLYVADDINNTIRKVTPGGVVTTLAGLAGASGGVDGTGSAARFYLPSGVTVSTAGDLYVAEAGGQVIRKVTPAGVVTTVAGTLGAGIGNADGPAASARFTSPNDVAFLPSGDLLIVDENNHTLRSLSTAGLVTTFAGAPALTGSTDGTGALARFYQPKGVVVNAAGEAYVADSSNSTIRKITPAGVVTTFAGTAGVYSHTDGTGTAATFSFPSDLTIDPAGNLYLVSGDYTVRKITPAGVVTTLAGSYYGSGSADGTGATAQFLQPRGIGIDATGNLYVADSGNHTIRKITPAGVVTTFAGTAGANGYANGNGAAARFWTPIGIAVDAGGNVYVSDGANNALRKITPAGDVTTLAGGFNYPGALTVDTSGNLYLSDQFNQVIRQVTPAGVVTTPVGVLWQIGAVPGPFPGGVSFPQGLAFTPAGDLLITTASGLMQATLPD